MRSQRQLRVGEEIRHALALLFQRGDVPWPATIPNVPITVTEVQVSPDLKNASIFIVPLGGQAVPETVKAFNNMIGFFRHEVAQMVELRYVPRLRFHADTSFEYAAKIDLILSRPDVAKGIKKSKKRDADD